ncbi:NAD-dependent epimerase/dehydratase family protein [Leifsonia sp. NPDC056665]|uniref:NAD-dependent epimerase/dehydratase family protein n=1 Tax=Leifsonia sp. NPDC056665 TaxID=3345901 RepID=UPI0036849B5B
MTDRARVFLTGAAGSWGTRILDEFRDRSDRFDVVALVLPNPRDVAAIRRYEDMSNLEVVFGDLTDYAAVERCVRGADYILHVGAAVSPATDDNPGLAMRVNVGSIRNIVRAVKSQPDPSKISVVGIGTIAESGDRNPPNHWGRVGDPLRVSVFDEYGQSKVIAEKELVDSGLPRWAWLRQTGIFHPGVLEIRDPIMTHSPFEGVMEWVSVEDAARLMVSICEPEVPEEFWNEVYNIGGGESWRLTNWDLQIRMTGALGVKDVRKGYDRNWFATRNFHGMWYTDSDRLEQLVPFRRDTFEGALDRAIRANPGLKMAGRVPAALIKKLVIEPLTRKPRGTMAYLRDHDEDGINAFFGSHEQWHEIGDWSTFWPPRPSRTPLELDLGFDESKPRTSWAADDYRAAADFRGGRLLSKDVRTGDVATSLHWDCQYGHTFNGSPRLVLSAGHWCPECVRDSKNYKRQAEKNQLLAQIEFANASRVDAL